MAVWLVRAGRQGEQEQIALDHSIVAIGWLELPDLSHVAERTALIALYSQAYGAGERQVATGVAQVWGFLSIKKDDLVILPLKGTQQVAIGRATGSYQYRTDLGDAIRHTHSVRWLRKGFSKSDFDDDISNSLGAAMTVCQIRRNNAERRIRETLGLRG